MRALRARTAALLGALTLIAAIGFAQNKPEDLAQKSDVAWLALTDSGRYAESWKAASAMFQAAVSEEKWVDLVGKVRPPLGSVKARKFESADHTRTLPGAPDGDYVVVKFDTSFEHKEAAVETVVSSLDKDGVWRVAGYFIK